jgi:lipid-A-disaccharide synthase
LLGDVFIKTAEWCLQRNPKLQCVIPAAHAARRAQLEIQLANHIALPILIIDGQSHLAMQAADAVLMASGTTTLECLLLKRPMVVAYKMAPLSYAIISRLLKSKYVSLPNVLADQELVPEILQAEATPENLGEALIQYLNNTDSALHLRSKFTEIHHQLRCNASEQAAEAIVQLITNRRATP